MSTYETSPRRREELEYVLPWLVRRSFNRVVPLRDGAEAYPAMLEAIRGARDSVHLETYTLADDSVGRRFQAALIERAAAGVEVRLLYDAVGSIELSSAFVAELRAAGVETLEFNPVAPWRARWGLNRRDHQKCLIVDGEIGFTGGLNIAVDYVSEDEGGAGWRDQSACLEGPAVFDLARNFRRTWIRAGGRRFPEPRMPASRPDREGFASDVSVVSNFGLLRSRSRMRHSGMHVVRRAQRSISIMNAYFIPARALRRALRDAVRRGVEVRVIVPAVSDVRVAFWASRHLYGRLLRDGVRILEWPRSMMHAKTAVVDELWTTIGTYNIDQRSLLHNFEVGLIVLDRALGAQMQRQFDEDAHRCREVDPVEWRRRPWWLRTLEWGAYRLRYWL